MTRLMRCNRYADCEYMSCVHFSIHEECTDFFHENGVCDGECSVFKDAHCIPTGEISITESEEWYPDFKEYCDIMNLTPTIRDQMIFMAGATFQSLKKDA